MKKIKKTFKSVRVKLFLTLSAVILLIIMFLIIINNFVLGTFYTYKKTSALKSVYEMVNNYYINENKDINIENELEKVAIKNGFDILIRNEENVNVYTSSKDFFATIGQINEMASRLNINSGEVLEKNTTKIV